MSNPKLGVVLNLSSCFRPTAAPPPISGNPNLTTSLYNTHFGFFSLTWSHTFLGGRSLHLFLPPSLSPSPSFSLHIKPFTFWNNSNKGSKKLQLNNTSKIAHFLWDFSRAKFGPQPDPQSGFYLAVLIDGQAALLLGDLPTTKACSKVKAIRSEGNSQSLVLRTEHVHGNKLYRTKANFGGKTRDITIDCSLGDELTLCFIVDTKRVLEIQHLKWKFRGNERIEIDGVYVNMSWDVYNWLFKNENGYALFMFRFENSGYGDEDYSELNQLSENNYCGLGFEKRKKMNRGALRSERRSSSFSSSLSSVSSSNSCSSVTEWESMEESELKGHCGFSLAIYAWKR